LPLAGEIVEFNDALEVPEAVNADPYGAGWMIKKVADVADYDSLPQTKHTKNL
jgi:glycine cleavage system H protein